MVSDQRHSGAGPRPVDVILYDGVCALCNGFVRFVLARDLSGHIRFAPLQSEVARSVLRRHGRSTSDLDTVYLITDYEHPEEKLFERSAAVLETCRRLGGPWVWLNGLRFVPRVVRDLVYRIVARLRYWTFGKYDHCPLPPPAWQDRFLQDPGSPPGTSKLAADFPASCRTGSGS